jgi:hypothetical protein
MAVIDTKLEISYSTTGGQSYERGSTQEEMDAVQRRTKTEVGQERYGDKKNELMNWADQWHQKSAPDATKEKTD